MRRPHFGSALSVCLLALAASGARAGTGLVPAIESAVSEPAPAAIRLADLDGDSILDAALVAAQTSTYGAYHGTHAAHFGPEMATGGLYLQPSDLVIGDFNGDGRPDLAAVNSACS